MDMLPEDNKETSQPANDSPQPQPNAAPEAPSSPEPEATPEPKHVRSEEAFAEFRRELREEDQVEKKGFRAGFGRLMQRLFRRKKAVQEEPEEAPSRLDELIIPEASTAVAEAAPMEAAQAAAPEAAPAQPAEGAAAEFRSMVHDRLTGAFTEQIEVEPASPPPEVLHDQAGLQPISPAAEPEEIEQPAAPGHSILSALRHEGEAVEEEPASMREAALEDYVVAPAEEETGLSTVTRMRRSWRDMRPIDRRLLVVALVIVGLAVLTGSGFVVLNSIPTPTPAPTATASILPIPVSISLPGGLVFPLAVGIVGPDGKWNPTGPEWLRDTEICRWVALPYSVQLEAVLRTLKANDEIKLSMSNYDSVSYKVESIQQVPVADIPKLAPSTPSLLVILSKQDSDSRWVVTAKP